MLLLDEPTNHLDHDSIVWLRDWIKTFPGGVMIISHDVKLLGDTVNQVFYLDANRAQIDIYHLGWSPISSSARKTNVVAVKNVLTR